MTSLNEVKEKLTAVRAEAPRGLKRISHRDTEDTEKTAKQIARLLSRVFSVSSVPLW